MTLHATHRMLERLIPPLRALREGALQLENTLAAELDEVEPGRSGISAALPDRFAAASTVGHTECPTTGWLPAIGLVIEESKKSRYPANSLPHL
jgi:hypothetical protein